MPLPVEFDLTNVSLQVDTPLKTPTSTVSSRHPSISDLQELDAINKLREERRKEELLIQKLRDERIKEEQLRQ
jgi:hypothetical protein